MKLLFGQTLYINIDQPPLIIYSKLDYYKCIYYICIIVKLNVMWSKEISIKTEASKEQIWKYWTKVANWNVWDNQVISSSINGEFRIGQTGQLVPNGGPKSEFELIEVTKHKSFTSRSKLPFTKMDFVHQLEEVDGHLVLTHKVEISGKLTFIFSRLIGEKIIKHLPVAMNKLSTIALNDLT